MASSLCSVFTTVLIVHFKTKFATPEHRKWLVCGWQFFVVGKFWIKISTPRDWLSWRMFLCFLLVDCVWNVMAHAQKPDFVFRRIGRVHLNRRGRQFSRLLAAELCASAVVMQDTPCSEVVWRVLATHSIRQFPLHFPSRASPCAITFRLDSTFSSWNRGYLVTVTRLWAGRPAQRLFWFYYEWVDGVSLPPSYPLNRGGGGIVSWDKSLLCANTHLL
jgi:hypothetical protein